MFFRKKHEPTCFLHIGPHKTGSTSIQNFMAKNRAELKRRSILYPKLTDRNMRPSQRHGVLRRFDAGDRRDAEAAAANWKALEQQLGAHRGDVALSSEFFTEAFRDAANLDVFLDFFERLNVRVTVVAYVRDQPDWLNSWFVENQKRLNGAPDFEDYVAAAVKAGRVDPWRYLRNVIDNPRLTLDLVLFEQAAKTGLEADFARRIGVPANARLEPYPRLNPNAGAKAIYAAKEILMRSNKNLRQIEGYPQILKHFRTTYEGFSGVYRPYSAIDDDLYARISAQFRDGNERLARRFFGVGWAELYPARARTRSEFDPAEAPAEERGEVEHLIESTLAMIEA